MAIEIDANKVYSVEEIAVLLQVDEPAVRRQLRRGILPGAKLGKRWYVSGAAILAKLNPEDRRSTQRREARTP